jgi:hypothetical protein
MSMFPILTFDLCSVRVSLSQCVLHPPGKGGFFRDLVCNSILDLLQCERFLQDFDRLPQNQTGGEGEGGPMCCCRFLGRRADVADPSFAEAPRGQAVAAIECE